VKVFCRTTELKIGARGSGCATQHSQHLCIAVSRIIFIGESSPVPVESSDGHGGEACE
jgi:hypothetical protein